MIARQAPAVKAGGRCCRWLEGFRTVVVETLRRQRLSDAEVARALGIDRSYIGKVRRGERPLTDQTLDQLIDLLRLDRRRLATAVDMMDRPELYLGPTFRNVWYYAHTILADIVEMAAATGDLNCGMILAALTWERCEVIAHHAVEQLAAQFASFDPFCTVEEAA